MKKWPIWVPQRQVIVFHSIAPHSVCYRGFIRWFSIMQTFTCIQTGPSRGDSAVILVATYYTIYTSSLLVEWSSGMDALSSSKRHPLVRAWVVMIVHSRLGSALDAFRHWRLLEIECSVSNLVVVLVSLLLAALAVRLISRLLLTSAVWWCLLLWARLWRISTTWWFMAPRHF